MAEEIIFKTKVDTGDSVTSVDNLDNSVKNLAGDTSKSQEEFTRLRNEIKKQSEEVDKLSKKYGENSKEADEARKALGGLNNAYDALSKTATDLGAKFEDVYGELQPLSSRLGEIEDRMYELALAGQQNTKEFETLQAEVVRYRQTIIQVDAAVDKLAEQGKGLGTALQIGSDVVAGYGAMQGVMALVGAESEELEKTFIKLQAVQTVLASLEQLKMSLDKQSLLLTKGRAVATGVLTVAQNAYTWATGATTGAMKALRLAMLAIPIVAIVAGIMAIVGAMKMFNKEVEVAEQANEDLTKSFEKQEQVFNRLSAKIMRDMDNRIALAKAEGATREELHQLELERLSKEEGIRQATAKKELGLIKSKQKIYKQFLKEGNEDRAKEIAEEIKQTREKYQQLKALDGQYNEDKKILKAQFDKETDDINNAKEEERKNKAKEWADKRRAEEEAEAKLKLERERLYQDLMVQNIEDENLRKRTAMNIAHERERQDLVEKYGQDAELIKQLEMQQAGEIKAFNDELQAQRDAEKEEIAQAELERDRMLAEQKRVNEKAQLEGELIAMREDFEATQALKAELALIEMEQALEQENLTEGEKFKIKEEYNAKLLAIEEESAERRKQLNKDVADASISVAEQGLAGAQAISDAVFSIKKNNAEKGSAAELAAAKKQFETNKKIQIASAVISGIQGVINALTAQSVIPEPFGTILKGINAGIVAGTTIANIAKIKSTKFDGGGGGGASAPTVRPPSIPSQAEISGGTENESTLTDNLPDNNNPNANKVVLVDSDIKAGLANESKVDVISTIG